MTKVIIVSGGFDPVHIGHVRMFRQAAEIADTKAQVNQGRVIVALNSDEWLKRKKGKPFMLFEERKEILEAMDCVTEVIKFDDSDETACDAIKQMHEKYEYLTTSMFGDDMLCLANGGDRIVGGVPSAESSLCKELGIKMLWGIGGEKVQSSSSLIRNMDHKEYAYIAEKEGRLIEEAKNATPVGELDESTTDSND